MWCSAPGKFLHVLGFFSTTYIWQHWGASRFKWQALLEAQCASRPWQKTVALPKMHHSHAFQSQNGKCLFFNQNLKLMRQRLCCLIRIIRPTKTLSWRLRTSSFKMLKLMTGFINMNKGLDSECFFLLMETRL